MEQSIHITEDQAINLLAADGYFVINKKVLSVLGLEKTMVIFYFLDKYKYNKSKDTLDEEGMFYFTRDFQQENLGMTDYSIRKCIKELKALGLLQVKRKGMPSKFYYKVDVNKLLQTTSFKSTTTTASSNTSDKCVQDRSTDNTVLSGSQHKSFQDRSTGDGLSSGIDTGLDKEKSNTTKNTVIKTQEKKRKNKKQKTKKSGMVRTKFPAKKEKPAFEGITPESFETFWSLYPRKYGKKPARQKWNVLCKQQFTQSGNVKPDNVIPLNTVLKQVENFKKYEWQDKDVKFIPHPITWLNQQRWEDEVEPAHKQKRIKQGRAGVDQEFLDYMAKIGHD